MNEILAALHARRRPPATSSSTLWLTAFCRRKYQSDLSREMSRSVEGYLKAFQRDVEPNA